MIFEDKSLEAFWALCLSTYPNIAKKALEIVMPFSTTYLCEIGFSCLLTIKTKYRNRLDPQSDLRLAISTKSPQFEKLVEKRQEQISH